MHHDTVNTIKILSDLFKRERHTYPQGDHPLQISSVVLESNFFLLIQRNKMYRNKFQRNRRASNKLEALRDPILKYVITPGIVSFGLQLIFNYRKSLNTDTWNHIVMTKILNIWIEMKILKMIDVSLDYT